MFILTPWTPKSVHWLLICYFRTKCDHQYLCWPILVPILITNSTMLILLSRQSFCYLEHQNLSIGHWFTIYVPLLTTNVCGGATLCGTMLILFSRWSFRHLQLQNVSTGNCFVSYWIALVPKSVTSFSTNFDNHSDMWRHFMFYNLNAYFKAVILTLWTPWCVDYFIF